MGCECESFNRLIDTEIGSLTSYILNILTNCAIHKASFATNGHFFSIQWELYQSKLRNSREL